jgi:hypothetical protein
MVSRALHLLLPCCTCMASVNVVCADFVTMAPDDVRDLHAIRDSRPFRGLFQFPHVRCVEDLKGPVQALRSGAGEYSQRSLWRGVVENPVAATVHFHHKVTTVNRVLFGIDPDRKQTPPFQARLKGVLGRLVACVRAVFVLVCVTSEACLSAVQSCVCERVQRAGLSAHPHAGVWFYYSRLRISGGVGAECAGNGSGST